MNIVRNKFASMTVKYFAMYDNSVQTSGIRGFAMIANSHETDQFHCRIM